MSTAGLPAMPARRVGTLQRPGSTLHYEVTGSGPAMLFLHGLGGNHLSWWQQVAHFSKTHTCVTLSARGFAPSSPVAGGPNPEDFAGDIAALIAHLDLDGVVLVGQSMGGWGAVEYAIGHSGGNAGGNSSKLRALVLAATTGTIDPLAIDEPEKSRLQAWEQTSMAMAQSFAKHGIHVAAGARMAAEQPHLHLLYKHIDDMNAGLDKTALRTKLWHARTRPARDLATIDCPILFVSGDEDIVIPPFAADAIARHVPRAKVAHIPHAGHSAYFEHAAAFNAIVDAFLMG